jgi:hypothetical protein
MLLESKGKMDKESVKKNSIKTHKKPYIRAVPFLNESWYNKLKICD